MPSSEKMTRREFYANGGFTAESMIAAFKKGYLAAKAKGGVANHQDYREAERAKEAWLDEIVTVTTTTEY